MISLLENYNRLEVLPCVIEEHCMFRQWFSNLMPLLYSLYSLNRRIFVCNCTVVSLFSVKYLFNLVVHFEFHRYDMSTSLL